jgi:hypothetical protein
LTIVIHIGNHINYDKTDILNIEKSFNYNAINCSDFKYLKINFNTLYKFYGIYDCSQLCLDHKQKHKIHYDLILRLRLRLDNYIINNFNFIKINDNLIIVNQILNYRFSVKLHDYYFICIQDTYFKIANMYKNLPNIIEFINNNKCWLPVAGYQETLLFVQAILCNIKTSNPIFGS